MKFDFDLARLNRLAAKHGGDFRNATPFPHAVIDDFLPTELADRILEQFPNPSHPVFSQPKGPQLYQPKKLDMGVPDSRRFAIMPPFIRSALLAFNSAPFIEFMEKLSGIQGLVPDPYFLGGGIHQTLSNGRLAVHEDFNYHPKLKLFRRINVLFYLNKDWQEEYKGHLELWEMDHSQAVKEVLPQFNRLVAFNIFQAPHGHPKALCCPPEMTRKSLALYYYTVEPQVSEQEKTLWAQWKVALPPKAFFEEVLPPQLTEKYKRVRQLDSVLRVDLSGANGGVWTIDLTGPEPKIEKGAEGKADCCLYMSDHDFWLLITRQVNMQEAAAGGAVRTEGDISLLMSLFQGLTATPRSAPISLGV